MILRMVGHKKILKSQDYYGRIVYMYGDHNPPIEKYF